MSKLDSVLNDLPIISSLALRRMGYHPRDILAAETDGTIVRPVSGLIVRVDVFQDPDFEDALACARTKGVIAHLSAAARHGLCDALPPKLEMIVPMKTSKPPTGLPIRIIRTAAEENLAIGVDSRYFHGWSIRMTNPARTIVDLYRIEPEATRQHAIAALATYVERHLPTDDLWKMADRFRLWDTIGPELETLVAGQSMGMTP